MAAPVNIEIGSGHIKGSFGFGNKQDFSYNVPDGAINVFINYQDDSSNALNIGSGQGKASLSKWKKGDDTANVHAWVNGAAGPPNEIRWTVFATIMV